MLQIKTEEQKEHILNILGTTEPLAYFPLDFKQETDGGYMECNDRIYIDGDVTFCKMAEIVDYLREQNKEVKS